MKIELNEIETADLVFALLKYIDSMEKSGVSKEAVKEHGYDLIEKIKKAEQQGD